MFYICLPSRVLYDEVVTRTLLTFFWLVSLLLASLVWFISSNDATQTSRRHPKSVHSVTKNLLFCCCRKTNEGLLTLSQEETMPISIRRCVGLRLQFSVVNILADSVGPGTIGIHGDSQHYFLSSAFMTMAIILLHMFWGVVFFDGCEKQRWWAVAAVVASHLMVSCLTFQNPEYVGSLVPTYIILFLMGVWAFYAAAGSLRNLKLCLTCKDKDFLLANHRSR
uniref:Gamma-secretase subunit APH-1 n=1 Tax=Cyclopterus lumpus TaxID=8103 RepID=A0A8C2Z6J3_CYCLU